MLYPLATQIDCAFDNLGIIEKQFVLLSCEKSTVYDVNEMNRWRCNPSGLLMKRGKTDPHLHSRASACEVGAINLLFRKKLTFTRGEETHHNYVDCSEHHFSAITSNVQCNIREYLVQYLNITTMFNAR